MSSLKIPTTFTAVDKFSSRLRLMRKNTSKFARSAEANVARVNMAFRKMMSPLGKVNRMLGGFGVMLGTAAMVGAIGGAINTFKDFEQANANVASVLGTTTKETQKLQDDAKLLGATTAFTASEVAGLQTEYAKLGFSQNQILDTTEATLNLAAAAKTDLSNAAAVAGGTLNAFGLQANQTGRVTDIMAKSFSTSALDISKFQESMKHVAPVAKSAGVSIETSTALLGTLADAGIQGSQAGTALRRIMNEMAKTGKPFNEALADASKNGLDLAGAEKLVGKNAQSALLVLAENQKKTEELTKSYMGAGGAAREMADKQLDTLEGSLTKLGSAYEGFILSLEDGNGAFGKFIRTTIDATTEVLSLLSGTAAAESELTKKQKSIRSIAESMIFWGKVIGVIIGLLVAAKAITLAVSAGLGVYKAVLVTVTAAQKAWRGITVSSIAVQWAWNAAMAANPIGLVIAAVVALIALIAAIIIKWDEWGAAVALFMGPLGMVISLFMEFKERWDDIVNAFKTGGMIEGLKMIGKTILSALIKPIEQFLGAVGKVPGLGFAAEASTSLSNFRNGMFETEGATAPVVNNSADQNAMFMESLQTNNARVDLNVNDPNNRTETSTDSDFVTIRRENTFAF